MSLVIKTGDIFLSIWSENKKIEYKFEQTPDYLFIISLTRILVIIACIIFKFWQK